MQIDSIKPYLEYALPKAQHMLGLITSLEKYCIEVLHIKSKITY